MGKLQSRIALITGAARGIGAACAEAFVRHGARVYLTDIDADLGPATAATLGGAAVFRPLDVRLESDWDRVVSEILGVEGAIDVLVNNAGITGFVPPAGPQDPEFASLESWRAVHATNLDGVFLGCKHAIRAMKPPRAGGSIVNMSSRSGQVGIAGAAAYASSKAAVRNHTKSVALYCAEKNYAIRCNSIHPGAILTPMWDPILGDGLPRQNAIAGVAADIPLRRMGTAAEVAALALFLAGDDSAYITGAEFVIDGGILAGAAAAPRRPDGEQP